MSHQTHRCILWEPCGMGFYLVYVFIFRGHKNPWQTWKFSEWLCYYFSNYSTDFKVHHRYDNFFFFFGININNMILCFYWYSLFKVTAKFWVWMTERLELPLTEMGKTTRAVLKGSSRVHFEYVTLEMEGRWCCQNTVIQGKGLNYKYHLRRYHHIYNI